MSHSIEFLREYYNDIAGKLDGYRTNLDIRNLQVDKLPGQIHPFVRGLRMSALLIYQIRKMIDEESIHVDWGQVIDPDGHTLSAECDVLIYKGKHHAWNGSKEPVMTYKFVKAQDVISIVSCKSTIHYPSGIDKDFVNLVKPFCEDIYLFSEAVPPGKFEELKEAALKLGYKDFFALYEWDRSKEEIIRKLYDEWFRFAEIIRTQGLVNEPQPVVVSE